MSGRKDVAAAIDERIREIRELQELHRRSAAARQTREELDHEIAGIERRIREIAGGDSPGFRITEIGHAAS